MVSMIQQPNLTRPIQLIVTDIDGTLLNSKSELSERNQKALKAAMDKGVQVVLATGKSYDSGQYVVKRLNLNTPGVYTQGTTIFNADGTLRSQQTLPPAVARQVITFAEDRGFVMAIYTGKRILVRKAHSRMEELYSHYHEPVPEGVGPLQNVLEDIPINKLLVTSPGNPREIMSLRWLLNYQINGSARLLQAGIPDMMEILPPGASKGAAVKMLLKDMKVAPENVLALGDAENDVEMLQLVGIGVAVGNASDHVKQVANVVVSNNDEDGVAEAVERFVLTPEPAAPVAEAPVVIESPAKAE